MAELALIVADLVAEGEAVDGLVADLPAGQWRAPTPSDGWTVAHQIGHLAWTDDIALLSATDAEGFARAVAEQADRAATLVDDGAAERAARPHDELLASWRNGRASLARRLLDVPEKAKLPWFGPPMSPASMATARIMETWAHGLDVADALGEPWPATSRLKHVAHIGVRARDFAFLVNGLVPPEEEFRVELAAPDGELWAWGPQDARQRVAAPALDFCYLVCQRRPPSTLDVVAEGEDARRWIAIAQAFAGPPGSRRAA
ncbi:TIGR03084 family metal-binding protein [Segniliparus rugosus]|uniref:TIGR03084 family protein n=1 Tax=Segniliparus rugosus (strain ATCC BAA-974 / DSM 45345 / CCUG 50838 / CIP 108380 / JCM 13579 / CDC 945) TaxID=679197 RepID=E5XKW1_SEGRC|nr:TIGR03084 family metal-binding protein [Segniliparus rugosus]EFV15011.1 TIGR03084 family protein [Segniliparus rugosus ATCC BAA-974]